MKKYVIIVIVLGILFGYLIGGIIYKNYKGVDYIGENGNIYYVQYGVYTKEEAALENTTNLSNFIIREMDDKYYVYLGITEDYDVALKIQNYYLDKNIYTYIRSDYVENYEMLDKLKEYDEKIKNEEGVENVMSEVFNNKELIY